VLQLSSPHDLAVCHNSQAGLLAARVDFDLDWLRFAAFSVVQNDGEGKAPIDAGPSIVEQPPRSGWMAGHQRVAIGVQHEY
jgi:hypothetical protein